MLELSADSLICSVQEIACVKLNARLIRKTLQNPARSRFRHDRRWLLQITASVQNEVVIVALPVSQLRIALVNVLSDSGRRTEIEWGTFYRLENTSRNQSLTHWGELVGRQLNAMIQHGLASGSGQVEIRVISQI